MASPFRRRQQMVRALQASGGLAPDPQAAPAEPAPDSEPGREYAALRVLLHDNLRTLSDVQSIEARNPMKLEFARAFAPWIEGVLAAGAEGLATQDEILVTNLIWAIDYRDFDLALAIGAHVLKFGLVLPERYTRTPACFIAEEIATIALGQHEAVSLDHLLQLRALVEGHDMPDPVTAKLLKAIGRGWERRAEAFDPEAESAPAGGKAAFLSEGLASLKRALELDRNVGVKKDIERLERQLKAAPPRRLNRNNSSPHGARGADGTGSSRLRIG